MNIGILGGTFNPIHYGHLFIAQYILDFMDLDKILFIPSGNPPHKNGVIDKNHRLNMTVLAISDNERFEIDEFEVQKENYSYAYDTLNYLNEKYYNDKLYYIIGQDAMIDFDKWHRYQEVGTMVDFIVVTRGGILTQKLKDLYADVNMIFIDTPVIEISSTDIRNRILNKKSIRYFLSEKVEKYICKNNLYEVNKMTLEERIKEDLKKILDEKRYRHTLGVVKSAQELCELYGEDRQKATLAALLHDVAKQLKKDEVQQKIEKYGIELDEVEKETNQLKHAKIGRYIAEFEYGIKDEDILNAIDYHTTGRANMSKLEMIICLADYIDDTRTFDTVDEIRRLSKLNLEYALYYAINGTLINLAQDNKQIHKNTIECRNFLLEKCKDCINTL